MSSRQGLLGELGANSTAEELGRTLRRDGYAVLTDMVGQDLLIDLAAAAQSKLADRAAQVADGGRDFTAKAFWVRLLDSEMRDGRMPSDSIFVRFALQPALVQTLSEAMGGLPQLDYVLLTLSQHSAEPLAQSQLWHRDYDDPRTIKVFVYLTDVTSIEDGPFTFLPARATDRCGSSLRSHRSDADIFSHVAPEEKVEIIAPKLSVFAVETSRCLHMGSRLAPGHERLLYTATFTSFPKLAPAPSQFALTGQETEIERAILVPES
ncbi:hypothetical protein [Sphingomonas sp.]|uniref:hypothetical protein n=1 Tax=Sphingomonas sp. TaxID=28214 RepID=UPI002DE6D81A|nr:hypothetical protein [Sphingomonas sp.]